MGEVTGGAKDDDDARLNTARLTHARTQWISGNGRKVHKKGPFVSLWDAEVNRELRHRCASLPMSRGGMDTRATRIMPGVARRRAHRIRMSPHGRQIRCATRLSPSRRTILAGATRNARAVTA